MGDGTGKQNSICLQGSVDPGRKMLYFFFLVLVNNWTRSQAYSAALLQNLPLESCIPEDYMQRYPTSTESPEEWGTQLLLVPLKNFTFNSESEQLEVSDDTCTKNAQYIII